MPSQPKRSAPKANFAPTQNLPLVRKEKQDNNFQREKTVFG